MFDHSTDLIRTPFYKHHVDAGAKMVPFAGFEMPVQYSSIIEEHLTVRSGVGLFDLSHMGEFFVSGNDALSFLETVTTNDVSSLKPGQIQYSCLPKPDGGIVDDLLVYRLEKAFMLVVNAANLEKDWKWLEEHRSGDVTLKNRTLETGLLAIQGPDAIKVMTDLTGFNLKTLGYYHSATTEVAGVKMLFSRTGYTGEDGFELYIDPADAEMVWQSVIEAGSKYGMKLIGLGARDSLRLEMKMALYGNDIDETTSPIEAGLSWIVNLDKEFIGKEVIARQKAEKPTRRLVCLELSGRVFPRRGYQIFDGVKAVGKITSGTFSPSLGKPIALGYVPRQLSRTGSVLEIEIRNKRFEAIVVKPPFYKDASHL